MHFGPRQEGDSARENHPRCRSLLLVINDIIITSSFLGVFLVTVISIVRLAFLR